MSRQSTVVHAVLGLFNDLYGYAQCSRRMRASRMTEDHEQVTCWQCLNKITRPS